MLHALLLSSLVAAASPASADSAALAVKLAQAIANEHGANVNVYVGELPPGSIPPVTLPNYALLGSVTQAVQTGEESSANFYTAYYETPDAQTASDAYAKNLKQSGWQEPPMQQAMTRVLSPSGGFAVSGTTILGARVHHLYCGATGLVETEALASAHALAVTYSSGAQAARLCAISKMAGEMFGPPAPSPPPLPKLNAPAGVTMRASAFFPEFLTPTSRASLVTAAPLESVGGAFARAFVASGWKAEPAASGPSAYVQVFTKLVKGRHYQAVLSVINSGKPQHFDATVSERDLDRPPALPGFSF